MALAIDGSSPALAQTNSVVSVTTASFTPPAGSMLVVMGGANGGFVTQSISVGSSPALTFTQADQHHAADTGAVAIWTAPVAVSQAYTVTVTRTDQTAGSFLGCSCLVQVITGQEAAWGGAANGASGSASLPTANVTTTGTAALIFSVSNDNANNTNATAGTSQTILAEQILAGEYDVHYWRRNGTVTPSTYTQNLTAPTNETWNESVVEIRVATATSILYPRAGTSTVPIMRSAVR